MNIRKYTAATMESALEKVRTELGRDAVILHTRCFRRGTVLGLGGRQVVEVTASGDMNVSPRSPAAARSTPIERVYRNAVSGGSAEFAALKNDVTCLRTMLEDLLKQSRSSRVSLWPEPLQRWHRCLTDRGASSECAQEVLEPLASGIGGPGGVAEPAAVARTVVSRIADCIRIAEPIVAGKAGRPAVVAFVGPTGVGKTTTIAKLAAQFALRERKAVGLVTLDTYRIAAVEQLRTYAKIINIPLEVVLSPSDLAEAVERLAGCATVLVDTAGRSQRDVLKINDLKAFFDRCRPTQTHLVLSATADGKAISDTLEKFSVYRPECAVLTKLDELPACGRLLDTIRLANLPLSYVTTGQDVPDDIDPARRERLAALIAGEETLDR